MHKIKFNSYIEKLPEENTLLLVEVHQELLEKIKKGDTKNIGLPPGTLERILLALKRFSNAVTFYTDEVRQLNEKRYRGILDALEYAEKKDPEFHKKVVEALRRSENLFQEINKIYCATIARHIKNSKYGHYVVLVGKDHAKYLRKHLKKELKNKVEIQVIYL